MKLCAEYHDEIVFDSGPCPLCAMVKERDELSVKLAEKDEKIDQLEGTVADLDYKLEECQNT